MREPVHCGEFPRFTYERPLFHIFGADRTIYWLKRLIEATDWLSDRQERVLRETESRTYVIETTERIEIQGEQLI